MAFPQQLQQPWERERVYQKGYAKGLAASDPSRMITVNVGAGALNPPRQISFSTRQDTTMQEVLSKIHDRLPKIEHPFSISLIGANPQKLTLDTTGEVMEYLEPWDASFLRLRLDVHDPSKPKKESRSLSSRLRKVFGGASSNDNVSSGSADARAPSHSSEQSLPPPYER